MRAAFLVLLATIVLCAARPATAQPGVTLLPAQGTPDTVVAVSGSGFTASEAVDVYVDFTDTLLLTSSSSGGVSGSVTIPASESSGVHYITAIGRKSGDAAQAAFAVTAPWVEHGYGSAHLADNPWENSIGISNAAGLGALWTHIETAGATGATPAVTGGVVYVSTEAGVEALSAATGTTLWTNYSYLTFYASPTVVGNVVYIGSGSSDGMYALNAKTGAKIWGTNLGGETFSSATVAGGLVYVGCQDGKLYALSASTGTVVWTYPTGSPIVSTPTVANGVVYFGSENYSIYALNAATGAFIWSYQTNGSIEATAAVVDGVAYIGSNDGHVYALRSLAPAGGARVWSFNTGGALVSFDPAVANGVVYVGATSGEMYALNAQTGATIWSVPTGTGNNVNAAAVANGVVYFTVYSSNVNCDCNADTLYAVNAANGTILGTFVPGVTYFGSPAVSDGVVYLSAFAGNTYAFSLTANTNPAMRRGPPFPSSLHPNLRLPLSH